MFRNVLLASVASLGLLSPLAVTGADAHDFDRGFRHEHRHVRAFRVYYQDPCRPGWEFAGTFPYYREAERCAEQYRCRGFAISIR
jgi:hypothetical protein